MILKPLLQTLYQNHACSSDLSLDLEKEVRAFLCNQPLNLEGLIESEMLWNSFLSEEKIAQNWKILLVLNLLGYFSQSQMQSLFKKVQFLLHQPWNQHSTYLRALVALNQFFVGMPVADSGLQLLQNGAALIELQEYRSWQALPYLPCHTELATLICILAHLTQRQELQQQVLKMARWQLNTLDADGFPLVGLFSQEKNGQIGQHLLWNYLFFYAMSQLYEQEPFAAIAQAQWGYLQNLLPSNHLSISPLIPLLERLIQAQSTQLPKVNNQEIQLSDQIFDPTTSLVGYRHPLHHAVCTLHGEHTGLGCFRSADVRVINYGPQYLPLDNCQGFGIEGNSLSDQGVRKSTIHLHPQGFLAKGCVRLVDQPGASGSKGKFRGIWLETEQELKDQRLKIHVNFLSLNGWEGVIFSFFVKAQQCLLESGQILNPKTFERYEGRVAGISFLGATGKIQLNSFPYTGTMQVIPLEGENSFWGADFLVAYLLDPKQRQYQWQLLPSVLTH